MRAVYQDEKGRHWVTLVPPGREQIDALMGIPFGPPDVSDLGLPQDVAIRLHEQLFQRGLLTRNDLKGRSREVFAALQAAFGVSTASILSLYR